MASQGSDLAGEFRPEKPSQKTNLLFEWVNADGESTNVPASHGKWGGYRTTKPVAWIMNIAPGQWLARCRDEACGPSSFNEAKANALAMARGVPGDYFIENPIDHLNGLQALLEDRHDLTQRHYARTSVALPPQERTSPLARPHPRQTFAGLPKPGSSG